MTDENAVTNVYHLPEFQYHLLSVPQVTKEWKCPVNVFPDFYVFQDLCTGKVRAIGRMEGSLYLLQNQDVKSKLKVMPREESSGSCLTKGRHSKAEVDIWHMRFGHVSTNVLQRLIHGNVQVIDESVRQCTVCPSAKQQRLPFTSSSIKTSKCFDLVHMNL